MTTTAAQLFLCLTFLGKMMNMATAEATAASLSSSIARQQECTDEFKPVVCSSSSSSSMGKENLKESFSNLCIASRDGDYLNIDDCELIESFWVECTNPYALCAFANCTVNADETTASCGCYGFDEPSGISSMRISLIPDEDVRQATVEAYYEACVSSPAGCGEELPLELTRDKTPVCNAINDESLWPDADLVSTYSAELEPENNVQFDEDGNYLASWECEAAPGRFIPVCMLAPCRYSAPSENPYHSGQHTVTCTCPLVEVTVDYNVTGGLQDPCSKEVVSEGLYVQAAGGSIFAKLADDPQLVEPAWIAVEKAFSNAFGM